MTDRETLIEQLTELMEQVHKSASGRKMTPEFKTSVYDRCSDIATSIIDSVKEDERNYR